MVRCYYAWVWGEDFILFYCLGGILGNESRPSVCQMLLPRNYIPSRFIKLKWGLQDTNSQSVELPRVFKIFFLLFGLYQFNVVCVCVCDLSL